MEVDERSTNGRHRQKPKQKRQWQRRVSVEMSFEKSVDNLSRAGRETLVLVNRKRRKLLNTIPYTSCTIFDNTCPQYCWLRFGWIAEERCKLSGRLYRVIFLFWIYIQYAMIFFFQLSDIQQFSCYCYVDFVKVIVMQIQASSYKKFLVI